MTSLPLADQHGHDCDHVAHSNSVAPIPPRPTQITHVRRSLAVLLLGCVLLAACGGQSNDSRERASGAVTNEIRETVKGLVTAALNGDADGFSSYVASSCANPDSSIAAAAALRRLLPEGHLNVEVAQVDAEVVDENHVTVTALSELKVSVDDKPLPEAVALAIAEPELRFVREDGKWRLENCEDIGG